MYPLKLTPAFKDYLWGGTKLKTDFNKNVDMDIVAESWELSCHKDGNSFISNGEFKGISLADYIDKNGKKVLGTNCDKFKDFPILIKLIDAKDNLSVQVHPDNEYAQKFEGGYGKTEMWYIVDCEPDATLLYGFKHKISKEEFKQRIEQNTIMEVLNSVPVKKGDVFFIDAKTLHAIGKGILIAEIQQNSNTTYRIYDYNRKGVDGKTRELHIDKAMDVTELDVPKVFPKGETLKMEGYSKTLLSQCEYFTVNSILISDQAAFNCDEKSFNSLLCLDGQANLTCDGEQIEINKGDSIFIPAGIGEYVISGKCELILTTI